MQRTCRGKVGARTRKAGGCARLLFGVGDLGRSYLCEGYKVRLMATTRTVGFPRSEVYNIHIAGRQREGAGEAVSAAVMYSDSPFCRELLRGRT